MNLVRAELAVFLLVVAWLGRHWFKAVLNPVTVLLVPFALTLFVEVLFMSSSPFSIAGALLIAGPLVSFSAGALIPIVASPVWRRDLVVRVARPGLAVGGMAFVVVVSTFGAIFTKSVIEESSLGIVRPGVFSRALVYDAIAGTSQGIVFRGILFGFFVSTAATALYWLAKGTARRLVFVVFALSFVVHSIAVASKLPIFLGAILLSIYFLIFRPPSFRRVVAVTSLLAVMIVMVFVAVSVRRHGDDGRQEYAALYYGLFGGPSAMSLALDLPQIQSGTARGLAVGGLMEAARLGSRAIDGGGRPLGQGFDSVRLIPGEPSSDTNIYTGIMYFYRDLGWLGTVLVFALMGVCATFVYRRAYRKPSAARIIVLANIYLLLACMPISTMTYYNFWWAMVILAPIVAVPFKVMPVGERATG